MKALGIISMVFAIISIFVPVIGPYLTVVCAFIIAFSAGPGLTFGLVAIGINLLNVIFLSPSLWITAGTSGIVESSNMLMNMGILFIGAQVIAMIVLFLVHKVWKNKQKNA